MEMCYVLHGCPGMQVKEGSRESLLNQFNAPAIKRYDVASACMKMGAIADNHKAKLTEYQL